MKTRKAKSPMPKGTKSFIAQYVPVPQVNDGGYAQAYARYLMEGKPNPQGRPQKRIKQPLWWCPIGK